MVKMTCGDHDATAVEHRAPLAQDAVGDPSAGQPDQVDHRSIKPINRAGLSHIEAKPAFLDASDHEQDQQRAHAVIAEALPHLGEKKGGESARVAEKTMVVAARPLAMATAGGILGR